MKKTVDRKLDLMARSLQDHINLARELKLDFVAQLLTMTAMEIKLKLHGISEQELEAICARAVGRAPPEPRESAMVIDFPTRSQNS